MEGMMDMNSQRIIEEVIELLEHYKNGELEPENYKKTKNMLNIISDEIGGHIQDHHNKFVKRKIYNEMV